MNFLITFPDDIDTNGPGKPQKIVNQEHVSMYIRISPYNAV